MARPSTKKETEVKEEVKVETKPKVEERKIDGNTPVLVMNNTTGFVSFVNKRTQAEFLIEGYGNFEEMLVSDLINMRSSSPALLNQGYLIILDDDVIKYLRLEKVYENILKPEDIDEFFKQNDVKMREILEKSPRGMKELLFDKAKEMVEQGHPDMDYNSKKRVFEDLFNVKFDDLL
jgi:hypothetical protein